MDRNGVTADVDDGIASEERQLDGIVDPAIGTYGIPDATELNANLVGMRELPFERFVGRESFLLVFGFARGFCIHLENIGDGLLVSCTEQAVDMDQTGE